MKKNIKLYIFTGIFIFIVYMSMYIAFIDTKVVCAKVKQEGGTKGVKSLVYTYKYNGKSYTGSFNSSAGICLDIECYQDEECLDVEVSTLLPFMSRVKVSKPKNATSKLSHI